MLREAVRLAIVSSHVHPEAVDGAFLIAKAVALLARETPAAFDPLLFLSALEGANTRISILSWIRSFCFIFSS